MYNAINVLNKVLSSIMPSYLYLDGDSGLGGCTPGMSESKYTITHVNTVVKIPHSAGNQN